MGELTGRQVVFGTQGIGILGVFPSQATFEVYRQIRRHPTIALARAMSVAPVVAADWTTEADADVPEEMIKWVEKQFFAIRESFIESALLGGVDFGFSPFEKVFEYNCDTGQVELKKLKPLLHDITTIYADGDTGAFSGFGQNGVSLPLENSLLISFRVEGTNWYGEPLLENVRETWQKWCSCDNGAARYDAKVAGSHWVVYYPVGKSYDLGGANLDNSTLAKRILDSLESSGSIMVPVTVAEYVEDLNKQAPGWKIELLSDNGARQPGFVDRENYLDKLLVRGMLMPERSLLEGQQGTKAEAGTHTELWMTLADLEHRRITRHVNWHVLDQLLEINFGRAWRGKIRLVASPLQNTTTAFLQTVYAAVLNNPTGFMQEYGAIDTEALKDAVGVPRIDESDEGGEGAISPPALEGVDSNTPLAATVRRVYRELEQTRNVA